MLYSEWNTVVMEKSTLKSTNLKHQNVVSKKKQNYLVLDKQNGANDFADCELAYTNLKMAVRIFRWRWNGMIRRGNEEREHPTQKPLELMKWCIGKLPEPSTIILDPFMGSGTTGVACAKMGRKFIGIEKDARYFDIACKRISDAYKQPDLFVPQPVAI